MPADQLVLVTGGSGFIGSRCILTLLAAGYRVRTTVRSLRREAEVRATLANTGEPAAEAAGDPATGVLDFVAADLLYDDGWRQAVAGCDFVLHVASPFPPGSPHDENKLIVPAREGTLRVLRAARDACVRRVVVTSSFAAVGYGHGESLRGRRFTETDWTDPNGPGVSPYVKSKTLAEKAAWEFVGREGDGMELSAVNPVGVFGPVLSTDTSSSILLVSTLLRGAIPAMPRMYTNVVDVRDVADLHLRAMTDPAAAGERFLAVSGDPMRMAEIAALLRQNLGEAARRVPTRELPDWVPRLAGVFSRTARQIGPELGSPRYVSAEKARCVLGWQPRTREDAVLTTARTLVGLGVR